MMKPIETSLIFIKPRPRLFHKVPVMETLGFVERFQHNDSFYPRIRLFVERMAESVKNFFIDDICELGLLRSYLEMEEYRMTRKGRAILRMRLRVTYDDGVKYNIAANIVRRVKIRPIIDVEPKIMESQAVASAAKNLSKSIGEEIGITF